MRNVIFLCLAIFAKINSQAQPPLTNGQVYNYEVGDVIQTGEYTLPALSHPTYNVITRTILAKNILPNDAVSYQVKKNKATAINCPCPITFYPEEIVIENYYNLSQPVTFYDSASIGPHRCFNLGVADSITDCNRRLVAHYEIPFDSTYINCFEPPYRSKTYLQGVGDFVKTTPISAGVEYKTYLIAYIQNAGTCGNMLPVATQNTENGLASITIFPNPITNQLSIAGGAEIETYKIFDLNGACVQMGTISGKNIDVSALPKGNFIGVFYAPNGDFVRQKLTKL